MFTKLKQMLSNSLITPLKSKAFWISNIKTLGLMFIIIFAITSYQQRNMLTGKAPDLPSHVNIDKDKPTLMYFWGSWCGVCKTTSPSVSTLTKENLSINEVPSINQEPAINQESVINESDYNIISVALSSGSDQAIEKYMKEHGYQFNVINDDEGDISQDWGVAVTPSIFIINTQGDISYTSTGITSLWGMRLRLWLASN